MMMKRRKKSMSLSEGITTMTLFSMSVRILIILIGLLVRKNVFNVRQLHVITGLPLVKTMTIDLKKQISMNMDTLIVLHAILPPAQPS